MKSWMSLKGNFIKNENNIVFQGSNQQLADNIVPNPLMDKRPAPD